ncbi:raffinose synthase Sip1 [Podospora aff. communis PSN243]|uniref:Raffinose synthase Sip1 n=1 Tax=Podospora aff. communis PSN243 TaxID=3040156 RepID=A0AAV9GHB8_9PEZI|nr:raffinose synthase Sip1 [Podospora aff. communis PSN243]
MIASIATYPPLEQVSQLHGPEVTFTALLEVPAQLAAEPWELALWHSSGGGKAGEWVETKFLRDEKGLREGELHGSSDDLERLYFTTDPVPVRSTTSFTVKFRQGLDHDWRWIRDEQGIGDGVVIVEGSADEKEEDLPDLIRGLNPDLGWRSHMSQCPNTQLWSVQASVPGVAGDTSAFADVTLGVPWGDFIRWFALVRLWTPWLAPRHGKSTFEHDKDAVMCSFLSPEGKHLTLLGLALGDVVTVLRSDGSGKVSLHIRNDSLESGTGTVLVAVGNSFESSNAAVMYHARSIVRPSTVPLSEDETSENPLQPNWYEDWYEGLGYCEPGTWNALGQRLTHEKVLNALDALDGNGIKIATLIIDDNWQDIDYRGDGQWQHGWNDFEAEPKTFPKGLKGLVSEIRQKHRNIQHIAVWHALLGYWAGIAPGGQLAKKYKAIEVVREDVNPGNLPIDSTMTVVAQEDVGRFYRDFYQFLYSCGVDGVKTDGQYMVDLLVPAKARRELIHTYLREWGTASLLFFSNKVISCMSLSPQMLFSLHLASNTPARVVRNSDDFFPEVPSSHPWHVWSNAYNSLLTMHLNIVPDWDMFQTVHPYSGFHAAARCVSGGPIYITDAPGQHNIDLIKQMTGTTTRGKTVLFRPSVVGRAIDPYARYEDHSLLKIGAYHGRAATGTPIMGVFNVTSEPITELIHLSRFSGSVPGTEYIIRSHVTGKVSPALKTESSGSVVTVSLGQEGYDVLSAFPLATFEGKTRGRVSVTNLGLVGKMTGCAAILNSRYSVQENGRLLVASNVKALGVVGLYISTLPELSITDDLMASIQGQVIPPRTVSIDDADGRILKIDVETAWNEMGLRSGWSNEVEVKVYFPL